MTLSDTGRVAGFVTPGAAVAIFIDQPGRARTAGRDPAAAAEGQVIAVGATTVVSTTTTDPAGAQTTEQLPKTLFTLAVDQDEAEKIMFAAAHGELTFALLNDKSKVKAGPGISTTQPLPVICDAHHR